MNQYNIKTEIVLDMLKRQLDVVLCRTGLCFWLSPANCLLLDTGLKVLKQFYTLTNFSLQLWSLKLPNFRQSMFWGFSPGVDCPGIFVLFQSGTKFHLIAKSPNALKHRVSELEATDTFLKWHQSHLNSEATWVQITSRYLQGLLCMFCGSWRCEGTRLRQKSCPFFHLPHHLWAGTRFGTSGQSFVLLGWRFGAGSCLLWACGLSRQELRPLRHLPSISHVCLRVLLLRLERAPWQGDQSRSMLQGWEKRMCPGRGWRNLLLLQRVESGVTTKRSKQQVVFALCAVYFFIVGQILICWVLPLFSLSPEELMWLNLCLRKAFIMRNGEVLFKSLVFICFPYVPFMNEVKLNPEGHKHLMI